MKKDLFLCRDIREDFQRWLGCGVGPLTISQRGTAAVILNSLPKTEEIDYLYCAAAESGGVTWFTVHDAVCPAHQCGEGYGRADGSGCPDDG